MTSENFLIRKNPKRIELFSESVVVASTKGSITVHLQAKSLQTHLWKSLQMNSNVPFSPCANLALV